MPAPHRDLQVVAPFYDRSEELAALQRGWNSPGRGGLAMVYGRRRLGKTYLLQHFFTSPDQGNPPKECCYYLADQSTADLQRQAFAERLLETFPDSGYTAADISASWNALLLFASARARERGGQSRIGLVLDEFPFLVAQTKELPSILQAWWDTEGLRSPLFVVLCGSRLSAMTALRVESAPLFGRFNAGVLQLQSMRYDDVAAFYEGRATYGTAEKLLMYGALGGTPRYHAMVNPDLPWSGQIVDLMMRPGSPLESELRFLLSSEQIRDPSPYNAILGAIAHGRTQYGKIQSATGIAGTGLAGFLKALIDLQWVRQERSYGEITDRRSIYRLADPFLTFWYRFIGPLGSVLQFNDPRSVFESRVAPHLDDYMGGSVFEGICAQWLQRHARFTLGPMVLNLGRYWSRDGSNEIDLVGDLEDGTRLFGECKWSARSPVDIDAYLSLRAKVARLPRARWGDGASYILFSVGGFTAELQRLAATERLLHLVDGAMLYATP